MKVVINESQKRLIIESLSDSIEGIKDECVSIFKKVLEDTKQQVNVNLMMLSTWGFSVGGFLGPISLWLSNKNPQLSDMDISLILSGVICTLLYDNKDYLSKIVSKIKEKNLFVDFKDTVKKSLELKNVLFSFLKTLKISGVNVLNILSYAFLVPMIPVLFTIASTQELSPENIERLTKSISGFGLVTISSNFLRIILIRILKRFSNN